MVGMGNTSYDPHRQRAFHFHSPLYNRLCNTAHAHPTEEKGFLTKLMRTGEASGGHSSPSSLTSNISAGTYAPANFRSQHGLCAATTSRLPFHGYQYNWLTRPCYPSLPLSLAASGSYVPGVSPTMPDDGRFWETQSENRQSPSPFESHDSDDHYEQQLVDEITTPVGVRVAPAASLLAQFCLRCASLSDNQRQLVFRLLNEKVSSGSSAVQQVAILLCNIPRK